MRGRMGKGNAFVCVIAVGMCLTAMEVTARERETTTATKPPNETPSGIEVLKVESSNERTSDVQPNPECFCTYDQEKSLVKAHIGHKQLKRGDRIMRGETVTFECIYFGRVLLWKNSFRFFGKATMTCSTCTRWISDDLPTCNYTRPAQPVIGYEEVLKILPGGIVHMWKGESRRFFCSNSLGQPQWDYGDRKGVSVNATRDDGRGVVMFVSYLDIKQAEDEHSGRYECFKQSQYGGRFGSAFLNIQVNEALCSVPSDPVNGRVVYTSLEYGAELQYECNTGFVLKKQLPRTCSEDGRWSNGEPECINRTSSLLLSEKPVLASPATGSCSVPDIQNGEIGRLNSRTTSSGIQKEFIRVSSAEEINATDVLFLRCKDGFLPVDNSGNIKRNLLTVTCIDGTWSNKLQCYGTSCDGNPPSSPNAISVISSREHGAKIWHRCRTRYSVKIPGNVTCHFGSWIGVPPKCLENPCHTRELNYPGLVKPTQRYVESGESLEIHCEHRILGSKSLRTIQCFRGKWNIMQNPCTEYPRCSIEDLLKSIDHNVEPDMTGVSNEFMPSGSTVRLECSGNLILTGNSEALCGNNAKWELGRYQCIPGCVINIDPSSHLLVEPVKDVYHLGDSVILSCPPGEEMSNDVVRIMCLGGGWTDSLPFCKE